MKRNFGGKAVKREPMETLDDEEEEEEEGSSSSIEADAKRKKLYKEEEEQEEEEEVEAEEDEEAEEGDEVEEDEAGTPAAETADPADQGQADPMGIISTLFNGNAENGGGGRRMTMGSRKGPNANDNSGECHRDTRHFNAALVEEVSRHPALFDQSNLEYKSTDARNRHWDQVAARMCQPVEFVRTRWKTLRDRFKKEVRRQQQQNARKGGGTIAGGSSGGTTTAWQHYREMLYLLPFIRDKLLMLEGEDSVAGNRRPKKRVIRNGTFGHRKVPRMAKGPNGGERHRGHREEAAEPEQKHPPAMLNSYAAILDLARSAVTKLSPPPAPSVEEHADEHKQQQQQKNAQVPCSSDITSTVTGLCSPSSSNNNNNNDGGGMGGSGGGTAIVTTNLLRPFPSAPSFLVPHPHQQRPKTSSENGNAMEGSAAKKWEEDDRNEDELFCRIVYRKLRRLGDERLKEFAKARIMDLLVDIHYGDGGAGCAGNSQ